MHRAHASKVALGVLIIRHRPHVRLHLYRKRDSIQFCLAVKFTARMLHYHYQRSCFVVNFIAEKSEIETSFLQTLWVQGRGSRPACSHQCLHSPYQRLYMRVMVCMLLLLAHALIAFRTV